MLFSRSHYVEAFLGIVLNFFFFFPFFLLLSVFLLEIVYILETDAAYSISVGNVVLSVCACSSRDLYLQPAPRLFS